MPSIKRLSASFIFCSVFLCSIPCIFLLSAWQWHSTMPEPSVNPTILFITETGSLPYAVLTGIIFACLLLWQNRSPLPLKALRLLIILSIAITQIEQNALKHVFKLPRPYIAAINAEQQRSNTAFYALPKAQQMQIVRDWHLAKQHSAFLTEHRVKEIAYRFPSGHSIFSASWALLFAFFCASRWLSALVILWSALVMASRVWLGMHLPIDLLAGVSLAIISNTLLIVLFLRYHTQKPSQSLESQHSNA